MRTVYGANGSPFVRKVCVMLAEKGLTYEQEPVIPLNVSAEFKKLSPLGKIPAYRDGEATLSDSSIICAYLERKHPEHPSTRRSRSSTPGHSGSRSTATRRSPPSCPGGSSSRRSCRRASSIARPT